MEAGLLARVVITAASIVAGMWMLTPSFMGPERQAELKRVCDLAAMTDPPEDAAAPEPWTEWVPCQMLVKGLDLQGGVDITLYVDVDEAVRSTVLREIQPLKRAAEDAGVSIVEVRRARNEPALLVQAGAGVTVDQVKALVSSRLSGYEYTTTRDENGASWMVFRMVDVRAEDIRVRSVEQAREVIENRINSSGVKEPQITRKGETGVNIQLPGESDIEKAKKSIGTTARLEFLLVDEDVNIDAISTAADAARAEMTESDHDDDLRLSEHLLDTRVLQPGQRLYWQREKARPGERGARLVPYVLKDEVLLTGDDVATASTEKNPQTGNYYVALDFKPNGSAVFADVTGKNVQKRLAIVLDEVVISAPVIQQKIAGTASISVGEGSVQDTFDEASELARFLRSGALPAPVSVGESRHIGPQLGEKAIREGTLATLIGCVLIFLAAGIYYRVSGLLADLSLAINGLLCLALIVGFGATLTLPGICGIALTIGMALDCNIIIFERIREELRAGKSALAAIEVGFDRASVAVIDSNICTLLAGVVLYSYGTGPLKGFAVTLMFGIFTTLFTGVFVSRTLMDWAFGNKSASGVSI